MSGIFKNFLDMPAPPGYVPGLGRGATGFTTRSDIGPARSGAMDQAFQDENDTERYEDADEQVDEENNENGLLARDSFDREDEEADRIYQAVDDRMAERRKIQRETREKQEKEEFERNNISISDKFVDLKRALKTVSADQWASLPEAGDLTLKNKRQRLSNQAERRSYAVPDSVLRGSLISSEKSDVVDDEQEGTSTDLRSISAARDKMLVMKLDQIHGNDTETSGTSTSIDPKGYLTSLSDKATSTFDVGDVKRVRPLLESLVKADPKDAKGWIGLCRLEEMANRKSKARSIIAEGCEKCPKNDSIWLENIRLNNKHDAKRIVARAIQFNTSSIKLWLAASDLEDDELSKKRVIQKALENNPTSDTLWRKAVNLESDASEARLLLGQAVELVPFSEDLWLALARLETPKIARKVLNKARKALKNSRSVWIAAARLEEQDTGDAQKTQTIFSKGVRELEREGSLPSRTQWITEAESCENEGAVLTCHAIINSTLSQGFEEESEDDKETIWLKDAQAVIGRGNFDTARAIYAFALREFPSSRSVWSAAIQLERNHGTKTALYETLERAANACPNTEEFWLMLAREKATSGENDDARKVLAKAFEHSPSSDKIWLAAFELEVDNNYFDRARKLLERARSDADTSNIWIRSILFEIQLGNLERALELIEKGLQKFPEVPELYVQKGKINERMDDITNAIDAYTDGTKLCPKSVNLWLLYSRIWEKKGTIIKSRTILDQAIIQTDDHELIWLEKVQLERRQKDDRQATVLVTRALQKNPESGLLWSELIWLQNRLQRKAKIVDAVKACENDVYVLITVARDMWANGKSKARVWFERAVKADPTNGDAWLWLYKYLYETLKTDREKVLSEILDQQTNAGVTHGILYEEAMDDHFTFQTSKKDIFVKTALDLKNNG